jgi:hypothetical protein
VAAKLRSLCGWQLGACLLGVAAGFVPGVSYTGLSTGITGSLECDWVWVCAECRGGVRLGCIQHDRGGPGNAV